MTRKRFIKLLMSKGIQRNAAQEIAARYNSRNIPYAKAYKIFLISDSAKKGVAALAGWFKNFATEIQKVKENFTALAEQLKQTFCDYADNVCELKKLAESEFCAFRRDPLPQPQKYICMKDFVIDRRKAINRIKKKKGTVFPVSFLRRFYSYQTKCLHSVAKCCIIKE